VSLDVYLELDQDPQIERERIFVRRDGHTVEITRDEWDEVHPDRAPVTFLDGSSHVFWANITHNLNEMAGECGLYEPMWRPEENGIETAAQLAPFLRSGLASLLDNYDRLRTLNPPNGWGTIDLLIEVAASYLSACEAWPNAKVRVSG